MRSWILVLTRAWTTLYTCGMPAALRDARRAEVDADIWSFTHDPEFANGWRGVRVALGRLLRGVPDDLSWRIELMDLRLRRRHPARWVATGALVTLFVGGWLALQTPAPLPDPPPLPLAQGPWMKGPVPPPPPPPPPPPSSASRRSTASQTPPPPPPPPPAPSFSGGRTAIAPR